MNCFALLSTPSGSSNSRSIFEGESAFIGSSRGKEALNGSVSDGDSVEFVSIREIRVIVPSHFFRAEIGGLLSNFGLRVTFQEAGVGRITQGSIGQSTKQITGETS